MREFDEPEAPLSPKRQIALLQLLIRTSRAGAQFIIATHSPILLACPGAKIYSFDQSPIAEVGYAELEHVEYGRIPRLLFLAVASHGSLTEWLPRIARILRGAAGKGVKIMFGFDRAGAFSNTAGRRNERAIRRLRRCC